MPRRVLQGTVVSDKMDKTITVLVERRVMHQKYKKYVKQSAKYSAHDETNACKEGDVVSIEECRPLSKNKSWKVIEGRATDGTVRTVPAFSAVEKEKAPKEAKAPNTKKAPNKAKAAAPKKAAAKKATK